MAKNYTMVENRLLEPYLKMDLSGADFRVLLFIIRWTVFFRRDRKEMANILIRKYTGLSESQVRRSLKKLADMKVISVVPSVGTHPQVIIFRGVKIGGEGCQNESPRGVNSEHPRGVNSDTQEIIEENTIYENKKERKEASPPSSIPDVTKMTLKQFAEYANSLPDDDEEE